MTTDADIRKIADEHLGARGDARIIRKPMDNYASIYALDFIGGPNSETIILRKFRDIITGRTVRIGYAPIGNIILWKAAEVTGE